MKSLSTILSSSVLNEDDTQTKDVFACLEQIVTMCGNLQDGLKDAEGETDESLMNCIQAAHDQIMEACACAKEAYGFDACCDACCDACGDEEEQIESSKDPGISKDDETKFHKKLDDLVHKTFGKRKDESVVSEAVIVDFDVFKKQHKKMYPTHTSEQIIAAWQKYTAIWKAKDAALKRPDRGLVTSHFSSSTQKALSKLGYEREDSSNPVYDKLSYKGRADDKGVIHVFTNKNIPNIIIGMGVFDGKTGYENGYKKFYFIHDTKDAKKTIDNVGSFSVLDQFLKAVTKLTDVKDVVSEARFNNLNKDVKLKAKSWYIFNTASRKISEPYNSERQAVNARLNLSVPDSYVVRSGKELSSRYKLNLIEAKEKTEPVEISKTLNKILRQHGFKSVKSGSKLFDAVSETDKGKKLLHLFTAKKHKNILTGMFELPNGKSFFFIHDTEAKAQRLDNGGKYKDAKGFMAALTNLFEKDKNENVAKSLGSILNEGGSETIQLAKLLNKHDFDLISRNDPVFKEMNKDNNLVSLYGIPMRAGKYADVFVGISNKLANEMYFVINKGDVKYFKTATDVVNYIKGMSEAATPPTTEKLHPELVQAGFKNVKPERWEKYWNPDDRKVLSMAIHLPSKTILARTDYTKAPYSVVMRGNAKEYIKKSVADYTAYKAAGGLKEEIESVGYYKGKNSMPAFTYKKRGFDIIPAKDYKKHWSKPGAIIYFMAKKDNIIVAVTADPKHPYNIITDKGVNSYENGSEFTAAVEAAVASPLKKK